MPCIIICYIVLGVIVFFCLLAAVQVFFGVVTVVGACLSCLAGCCCAAGAAASATRPAHQDVVVTQPATTGNINAIFIDTQQQPQVYLAQQGQLMYFQNPQPHADQPPPYQPSYQPQGIMYPPPESYPPMAMTPQADVNH